MWWNLTSFLLFFWGQVYFIENTEIYQPLFRPQATLAPTGDLFLLNLDPPKILVYNTHGHLIKTFGRKGKGPGEFTRPRFIFFDGNLFVVDSRRFHVFSLDGKHKKTALFPQRGIFAKVPGGWTAKVTDFSLDQGEILGFDSAFKEKVVLAKWGEDNPPQESSVNISRILNQHSLFPERAFFLRAPEGKRAYFRAPFSREILIFNTENFRLENTIHIQAPRVEIPSDYAEETLGKIKKRSLGRGANSPDYSIPKYFPIISHMEIGADGILLVSTQDPKNPSGNQVQYFSQEGTPTKGLLSPEAAFRVIGLKDGLAYVTVFEDDEELKIARIPLGQVNSFVKRSPISFFSN